MLLHGYDLSSVRQVLIDRGPDAPSMKCIRSGRSMSLSSAVKTFFASVFL